MKPDTPERLRIARELHDGIAQDLVGLGYGLDLVLAESELSEKLRLQVRSCRLEIDSLIVKVRSEILALRRLDSEPLHLALGKIARELCPSLTFTFELQEVAIEEMQRVELIAIASEIFRNITAHAGANLIAIKLYPVNTHICLEIIDDGVGEVMAKDDHWGLQGITERVTLIGASMTISRTTNSSIDGGTHIVIVL